MCLGDDMADDGKSPITDKPLNVPGQSVDQALREFIDDHFLLPMSLLLALCLACGLEWLGYVKHWPRHPAIFSLVTIAALIAAAVYWKLQWSRVKELKLGRDGERAVGQFLDMHVEPDAVVYHDVPSEQGNIDHVIICSRGIYVVETKTRTKPRRGTPLVLVENNQLTVGGRVPDRDAVAQARACANDLKRLLRASTGKPYDVRAVVVFPGWLVTDRREGQRAVWVLEPKALPRWIAKEPVTISPSDVSLASYHLSRYIRTHI